MFCTYCAGATHFTPTADSSEDLPSTGGALRKVAGQSPRQLPRGAPGVSWWVLYREPRPQMSEGERH